MKERLQEIAERIKELRSIWGFSIKDMAEALSMSEKEYTEYENGDRDFSFTFLYNTAKKLHVDMTELLTGAAPKLNTFCIIRNGDGLPMERRKGFHYYHLGYLVKEKISEPFLVTSEYDKDLDSNPIQLSYHEGQEFDYIIEGSLKMRVDNHEFVLNAGDSVYYDSGHGHGMVATGGQSCKFLAVVMKYTPKPEGE